MPLLSNLTSLIRHGANRTRLIQGAQAAALLKTVDDLLDESRKLLHSAGKRMPPGRLQELRHKHNELHLKVVDVKAEPCVTEQDGIVFTSDEEKEAFMSDVKMLLQQCETYHRDVVTASRRAQLRNQGLSPYSADSLSSQQDVDPAWLSRSMVAQIGFSLDNTSETGSLLGAFPEAATSSAPFVTTLVDTPESTLEPGEETPAGSTDRRPYYRFMVCANSRRRAIVFDPRPHYTDETEDDGGVLMRVGDMAMGANRQDLASRNQPVTSSPGPSYLSSIISSLGAPSLTFGGML